MKRRNVRKEINVQLAILRKRRRQHLTVSLDKGGDFTVTDMLQRITNKEQKLLDKLLKLG